MIRIDFYLLSDVRAEARLHYACRIAEKAYQQGHRVYFHTENQQETHSLDDLLWTYRDASFLPHNLYGEMLTPQPPIQIGHTETPKGHSDLLINLAVSPPLFYRQFKRVIEIVPADDAWRARAREHYKNYRTQGCVLQSHHINL